MSIKPIDILLVNSRNREHKPAVIPYGITYIASYLRKKGINVKIFDRNAETETFNESLERYKPKVVGFSVLTGPTIIDAINMSKEVSKNLRDTKIIWGGIHPSLFTKQCLDESYIDIVVNGEGEETTYELTKAIIDGKEIKSIKGIFYKDNGQIIGTGVRDLVPDLYNEIPLPAWDLLDMKQYIGPKFYASKVITFNTSRGCVFRCGFCHNPFNYNKRTWRGLSAKKIIKGIELLKDKYGINGIYFYEDDFDRNKDRVSEFAELLLSKKIKIKWAKTTRAHYANKERLAKEYEAGLRYVEYGVESGSERMLRFIKKDQTTKQIKNAFTMCRELKIKTAALFILGLPTETEEEFEQTREFVVNLRPHIFMPAFFKPYPGSELYRYCVEKEGFKEPTKLEDMGKLYSLQDSQEYSMSKAPIEKMLAFQGFCVFMNLKNEFFEALKTFKVKFLLQGLNFIIRTSVLWKVLCFIKYGIIKRLKK